MRAYHDAIGLLAPSHRAGNGFRQYTQADVLRLHRVEMLKQMGHTLADIRVLLNEVAEPDAQAMVARQLAELGERQRRMEALRQRLLRLQNKLTHGPAATTTDWLAILEMMTMQEQHLSPQNLSTLAGQEQQARGGLESRWHEMVGAVRSAMDKGLASEDEQAQTLAWAWMRLFNETIDHDADLALKLTALQQHEPRAQEINGITTAMMDWVSHAFAYGRTALFAAYLSPGELAEVRRRQQAHLLDWTPLFAEARAAMRRGLAPTDPAVLDLARRWDAMFRASYCGDDPALEMKVRKAFASEPDLLTGIGVDIALLAYIRRAQMPQGGHAASTPDMALNASKFSAHLTASLRAAHQLFDAHPLVFEDDMAVKILGDQAKQALLAEEARFRDPMSVSLRAAIVARSRVAEDAWAKAAQDGIRQYVILGAGLDTYACRHARKPQQRGGADARVFEVDLPAMQQWKREALRAAGVPEPGCLTFVPIDFTQSTLAQGLRQAGFNKDEPAFFSWLGVTVYLDVPAIWQTLDFIAGCAPSTQVVFDYCIPCEMMSPMERLGWEMISARLAERGEQFKTQFVPDELAAQMRAHGFSRADTLDVDALNACYFTDKEKGAGREDGLRLGRSSRLMHGWV